MQVTPLQAMPPMNAPPHHALLGRLAAGENLSAEETTSAVDAIMRGATVPVLDHVERLILKSKISDRVSLHLAKDQNKLARLNHMSSEDAAREIGIIEGRIRSAAKPKQQTQARKPVTPLRGGGASPTSGLAAVNAYMKKQGYRD